MLADVVVKLVILLFMIEEKKEHEHSCGEGNNIYYDLALSIPDAVLGTEFSTYSEKEKQAKN